MNQAFLNKPVLDGYMVSFKAPGKADRQSKIPWNLPLETFFVIRLE